MSIATAAINGVIVLVLAPLFDGVARKLRAFIHSRKGPPITQVYIDIMKLLGKQDLRCTTSWVFRFAPALALSAFLVGAMLTPMGVKSGTGIPGDMVTWIYVLTLGAAAIVVMASASRNPLSEVGGAREVVMMLSVEPVVVAGLLTAALKSQSMRLSDMVAWNLANGPTVSMVCAGVAFFLMLQAMIGRLPFDLVEAESEIVEGPLMEQSGPNLAVLKIAMLVRQLVYSFLFVQIFVPWPVVSPWPWAAAAAAGKVLVLFIIAAVVEAVSPRLRIDQAMSYMGKVLFIGWTAVAFAVIGV